MNVSRQSRLSDAVFVDLVKELLSGGVLSQSVSLLTGMILVVALWSQQNHLQLFIWYSLVVGSAVARLFLIQRYLPRIRDRQSAKRAASLFLVAIIPTGLIWGISPWLLVEADNLFAVYFTAMMIAGMCAGGVTVLSPLPRFPLAFTLPSLLPMVAFLTVHQPPLALQACLVIMIYGVTMSKIAGDLQQRLERALVRRHHITRINQRLAHEASERRARDTELQLLLDLAPCLIAFVDSNQVYRNVNHYYAEVFGREISDVVGHSMREVMGDQVYQRVEPSLTAALRGEEQMFQVRVTPAGRNKQRIYRVHYVPQVDSDDQTVGLVVLTVDITHEAHALEEWKSRASLDPLTGLLNQVEFSDLLKRAAEEEMGQGESVCVCYLDLDDFKQINDVEGHMAGDEALRRVAQVITQHIRRGDAAARMGGDEFAILLRNCKLEKAQRIGSRIAGRISQVWQTPGAATPLSASVGIAQADAESPPGQWLEMADSAMYEAKRSRSSVKIAASRKDLN